jgi:sulfate adenylyltransferase subunit 1 (EFTu-like GTPase family)
MEFLELLKKKEAESPLGVCIPDKAKKKLEDAEKAKSLMEKEERTRREEAAKEAAKTFRDDRPRFEVLGRFDTEKFYMITGRMLSGRIKKGDKLTVNGKKVKIKEIKVLFQPAKEMTKGQKGSLELEAPKGTDVKIDSIIEF